MLFSNLQGSVILPVRHKDTVYEKYYTLILAGGPVSDTERCNTDKYLTRQILQQLDLWQ